MIEKLNIEEIRPSSRRYPAIIFEQERDAGDQILELKSLSYENDGETYFKDISFNLNKGEKVLILSKIQDLLIYSMIVFQDLLILQKVLSIGV